MPRMVKLKRMKWLLTFSAVQNNNNNNNVAVLWTDTENLISAKNLEQFPLAI